MEGTRRTSVWQTIVCRGRARRGRGEEGGAGGTWAAAINLARADWLTLSALGSARRLLDRVADGLEDAGRRAAARAAGRDAAWHEGPDGRKFCGALHELDGVVSALRRVTLPEEEALR